MSEGPWPALSPLSERIQGHADSMGVARMLGVAAAPELSTLHDFIDTTPNELAVLDPATLLQPQRAEPRAIERPANVEQWLAVCTPQFFLRNTHRATREDTRERPEFTTIEAGRPRLPPPSRAVADAFVRPTVVGPTVSDAVQSYLAERAGLMIEPWHAAFGRPDPGPSGAPE